MRIDIVTLFPNMVKPFLEESIIKRAIEKNVVEVNVYNFRDYTLDLHNKVDDTPYGGGAGMVLMPQPIFDCIDAIRSDDSFVVLLTPDGEVYKQSVAYELTKKSHLILICGHYEGFDERIRSLADLEISIGDYILTGGEIPAMAITDSVIRLLPGVINQESHINDSFNNNLLDYPTYTKPRNFRGMMVPEVLLSGDHKKIEEFRKEEAYNKTRNRRIDLLKDVDKNGN